jgi:hypothetical protein
MAYVTGTVSIQRTSLAISDFGCSHVQEAVASAFYEFWVAAGSATWGTFTWNARQQHAM